MQIVKLKKLKNPHYKYVTTLANQSCTVIFDYSDYDESWYLSIKDSEGSDIKVGIRLKCGGFHHLRLLSPYCFLYVSSVGGGKDKGLLSYNNYDIFVGWEDDI